MESSCPCFFSLLRDIFLGLPDATAELDQVCNNARYYFTSLALYFNAECIRLVDSLLVALAFKIY